MKIKDELGILSIEKIDTDLVKYRSLIGAVVLFKFFFMISEVSVEISRLLLLHSKLYPVHLTLNSLENNWEMS